MDAQQQAMRRLEQAVSRLEKALRLRLQRETAARKAAPAAPELPVGQIASRLDKAIAQLETMLQEQR